MKKILVFIVVNLLLVDVFSQSVSNEKKDSIVRPKFSDVVSSDPFLNRNIDSIIAWQLDTAKRNAVLREFEQDQIYLNRVRDTVQVNLYLFGKKQILNNNFQVYFLYQTAKKRYLVSTQIKDSTFINPYLLIKDKYVDMKMILFYQEQYYFIPLCHSETDTCRWDFSSDEIKIEVGKSIHVESRYIDPSYPNYIIRLTDDGLFRRHKFSDLEKYYRESRKLFQKHAIKKTGESHNGG